VHAKPEEKVCDDDDDKK